MKQLIVSGLVFLILLLGGCKDEHEGHKTISDSYYTCPMHPSVVKSKPGACPVCNMSLIKVEKVDSDQKDDKGNYISIDKRKQELAGIKTDAVQYRSIDPTSIILGTVAVDEKMRRTISSRVKGRIDKLFVKITGSYLKRGGPLYSIYSELLLADKKGYLALRDKVKTASKSSNLDRDMLSAAKNKLRLWGLSENQISELEKPGNPNALITFFSTEEGYVSEVIITEGMYVEEGSPLLNITSLSSVWVEAQVYPNELTKSSTSSVFRIYSDSYPDEAFNGKLVYNSPVIEEGKRVQLSRIQVNNAKGKLIPGMMVSVSPQNSSQPVLAVPKSAVLLEKMKTAWVKTSEDTFEQRMVETGAENQHWIEILKGLQVGDIVVTEGSYLISSEFILKSGAGQRHVH